MKLGSCLSKCCLRSDIVFELKRTVSCKRHVKRENVYAKEPNVPFTLPTNALNELTHPRKKDNENEALPSPTCKTQVGLYFSLATQQPKSNRSEQVWQMGGII